MRNKKARALEKLCLNWAWWCVEKLIASSVVTLGVTAELMSDDIELFLLTFSN